MLFSQKKINYQNYYNFDLVTKVTYKLAQRKLNINQLYSFSKLNWIRYFDNSYKKAYCMRIKHNFVATN